MRHDAESRKTRGRRRLKTFGLENQKVLLVNAILVKVTWKKPHFLFSYVYKKEEH
jgi:hypothetical protein